MDEMFQNFDKEHEGNDLHESTQKCLLEVTTELKHSHEELAKTKKKLEKACRILQAMVREHCKDEDGNFHDLGSGANAVAIQFLQERSRLTTPFPNQGSIFKGEPQ